MAASGQAIRNRAEFEIWRKRLHSNIRIDFSRIIAHRAALRALPNVHVFLHQGVASQAVASSFALSIFRATALGRVICKYPHRIIERAALAKAALAVRSLAVVAREKLHMTGNVLATSSAGSVLATNENFAEDAISNAAIFSSSMWQAAAADIDILEEIQDPVALSMVKLWPDQTPSAWSSLYKEHNKTLSLYPADGWLLWKEWYRSIIDGKNAFGFPDALAEEIEIKLARGGDIYREKFWEQGPAEINRQVKVWVDETRAVAVKLIPDPTISQFILDFLQSREASASIADIRSAFTGAGYSVPDDAMLDQLSQLASERRIRRVSKSLYAAAVVPAPQALEQGKGITFASRNGELTRIAHMPSASEAHGEQQKKLFERLKIRSETLRTSFENARARYPILTDTVEDYCASIAIGELGSLDVDEVWINGTGLISQARAFAAIDPAKQVTEPLEPQLQALLGEVARLHGAFIMGFETGRELAEKSQIPLLTEDEFRALLQNERDIVRWLLESEEYKLADGARATLESLDRILLQTSESAEQLAVIGYPLIRNLLIFTAKGLEFVEKIAGRLSLMSIPVDLAVVGSMAFLRENIGPILAFANNVPELRSYIEYHLMRLEEDFQDRKKK